MKRACCPLLGAAVVGLALVVDQAEAGDSENRNLDAQRTLERAIQLAGPGTAGLSIMLATKLPDGASGGVEAWLLRGPDERPRQIVAYRESEAFRCASGVTRRDYQSCSRWRR